MNSFKKSAGMLVFTLTLFFSIVFTGNTDIFAQSRNLITENSVDFVRLGMTVAEARRAMRGYTFTRTSDGDGVALIDVRRRNRTYMLLYAGEEDPRRPINESARIENIEALSTLYRTAQGVSPRMPLTSVARIYGSLREIVMSEVESREFATFANQPNYLSFRVQAFGRTAGIYPRGQTRTTRANANARIYSIIINENRNGGGSGNSPAGFSSQFTDFSRDCNTPDGQGEESGNISSFCKGYGDYRLHVFDTATTLEINAETDNEEKIFHIASQSLNYDIERQRLEWRMADGKPFAVILQVNKFRTDENGLISYPIVITGSYYAVKGLDGYDEIDYEVEITRQPNVLERARQMADEAYLKKNPETGGGGGSSNASYQNLDLNQINQTIDRAARNRQEWVKSPMEVLVRIIGDFDEMRNRTIELSSPTVEEINSITVTVTNDGLLDDSVRTEKFVYRMDKLSNGVWKVTSGQKSWRCQQNRGHQDFSAAPCI